MKACDDSSVTDTGTSHDGMTRHCPFTLFSLSPLALLPNLLNLQTVNKFIWSHPYVSQLYLKIMT